MNVTIIADASFCPETHVGGYGYWIACERGRVPGGGPFKSLIQDANLAEMMAVCKAIHEGLKQQLIQPGDDILVQTDCMGAIDTFAKMQSFRWMNASYKTVMEVFRKLRNKHNLRITFRHVKGHTNIHEPRYAANRACDYRAKTAMRAERERVKQFNQDIGNDYN